SHRRGPRRSIALLAHRTRDHARDRATRLHLSASSLVAKGADGPLVTCHRSPCVRTACMSAEPAATPVRLLDASHASSLACVFVLGMVLTAGAASPLWLVLALVVLMVAVATSVHHAEVIAARVGSSLGAIVLALVVTVIEIGRAHV